MSGSISLLRAQQVAHAPCCSGTLLIVPRGCTPTFRYPLASLNIILTGECIINEGGASIRRESACSEFRAYCRCTQQGLQATGMRSHQTLACGCSWSQRSFSPICTQQGKSAAAQSSLHLSCCSRGHIKVPQVARLHHARCPTLITTLLQTLSWPIFKPRLCCPTYRRLMTQA